MSENVELTVAGADSSPPRTASRIVDMHAHALDAVFMEELARRPKFGLKAERRPDGLFWLARGDAVPRSIDPNLTDVPGRLESLKRRGVDLQLIAPPPGFLAWPGGAASVEFARLLNEHGARVAEEGQGHLELMATLALGEPERCAYELERAVAQHGIRSAILPTTAGGRALDEPEFDGLFSVAERLGVLLFMHPVAAEVPSRFPVPGMQVVVQWSFETALAVTRMIFEGVLDRYPGLQLLLAHGGGSLIFLKGRLNAAYEAAGWEADPYFQRRVSKPPGDYYRRLYFDTCALSPDSVRFTIDIAGRDRVMFGTDYPFDIGDPEGARAIPAVRSLPPDVQASIFHANADAVLNATTPKRTQVVA
jgi:aminocarboxymuconate-semialdehyde decarboxylase